MAELMANVDLAIGAAGSSVWERCCLGLPSIIIPIADNQKPIAEFLAKEKLAIVISDYSELNLIEQFYKKLNPVLISHFCDGLGVERVVKKMLQKSYD